MKISPSNLPTYIGPKCPFCGENWYSFVVWKQAKPMWAMQCQECKFTGRFYEDALTATDEFDKALRNYNK